MGSCSDLREISSWILQQRVGTSWQETEKIKMLSCKLVCQFFFFFFFLMKLDFRVSTGRYVKLVRRARLTQPRYSSGLKTEDNQIRQSDRRLFPTWWLLFHLFSTGGNPAGWGNFERSASKGVSCSPPSSEKSEAGAYPVYD